MEQIRSWQDWPNAAKLPENTEAMNVGSKSKIFSVRQANVRKSKKGCRPYKDYNFHQITKNFTFVFIIMILLYFWRLIVVHSIRIKAEVFM